MRRFLITLFIFPTILFSQPEQPLLFANSNSPIPILRSLKTIIPKHNITSLATDIKKLNWIGTLDGLICYNGKRWVILNTKNSKLPSNKILCIETENNTKYIGTTGGLVVIKNNNWEIYTTKNSNLPTNRIRKILIQDNVVWIATSKGLVKYSNGFEVMLSENKNGILDDDFISMNIDDDGILWLGTNSGLYSFKNII